MQIAKPLPHIQRPFSMVSTVMRQLGFQKSMEQHHHVYTAVIEDINARQRYRLTIPVTSKGKEEQIWLGQARVEALGQDRIPEEVRMAAWGKLCDALDYMKYGMRRDGTRYQSQSNGYMAANLKEMKQLGKEMESIETTEEVYAKGEVPDPKQ